jgi:hypothetical protein
MGISRKAKNVIVTGEELWTSQSRNVFFNQAWDDAGDRFARRVAPAVTAVDDVIHPAERE